MDFPTEIRYNRQLVSHDKFSKVLDDILLGNWGGFLLFLVQAANPPSIHFTRFWGDHTKFHARVSHISILEEVVLGRNPWRHFAKVLLIGWLIACWNLLLLSLACWCLWHAHNRSTQWKVCNSFIPKSLDAFYHFLEPGIFKDLQKGYDFPIYNMLGRKVSDQNENC